MDNKDYANSAETAASLLREANSIIEAVKNGNKAYLSLGNEDECVAVLDLTPEELKQVSVVLIKSKQDRAKKLITDLNEMIK